MLQQAIRMLGRATSRQEPALVIDLFAGTHTSAVAAHTCGCKYIGVDIDPEAERVGRFHFRRLTQTPAYAKDTALLGTSGICRSYIYVCYLLSRIGGRGEAGGRGF